MYILLLCYAFCLFSITMHETIRYISRAHVDTYTFIDFYLYDGEKRR